MVWDAGARKCKALWGSMCTTGEASFQVPEFGPVAIASPIQCTDADKGGVRTCTQVEDGLGTCGDSARAASAVAVLVVIFVKLTLALL